AQVSAVIICYYYCFSYYLFVIAKLDIRYQNQL
uniref:Uncharacterized protein n=1 Tax=Amphimedon queenslandica TaxID=400682 RepID=A0A1X7T1K6_AMPQE